MRRIVPFYSFTRKNIELQLKTLGTNPQRINQVMKLFSNNPLELVGVASGTPLTSEEQKALPQFIKESLGIQLKDTPEGLKTFVSSFGTPIEDFSLREVLHVPPDDSCNPQPATACTLTPA